ncbi:type VI secretion system baseplate subunit TssE [Planctomicrobium sp.]|nr:type VI secretion system baseplate subunit TssE [Planctomicrobium sp.]
MDRLIDYDPEHEQDEPQTENQILRNIQISVRRDIEDLLNTRYRCAEWPPQFNGLEDSLVNYGLPDFTAAGLNIVNDNELLTRSIEDAIRRFEPRLSNVKVERVRGEDAIDRTFRFRILGTLKLESVEQDIRFDSSLETISGQIEVK